MLSVLSPKDQLQLILDIRQRRRFVAKPQRHDRQAAIPKIDNLSNSQLERLAQLLGLKG